MSILSDDEITKLAKNGMIEPLSEVTKGLSSGVSSYGYDARLANKLYIFKNSGSGVIDPKNFDTSLYEEVVSDDHFVIPPHGFALGRTIEHFSIPRDVLVVCVGKSTYARCGLIVNVTPLEPAWNGYVTLEFSNTTAFPVKLYPNEGICQFLFFKAENVCKVSYADKKGKYQNQGDIVIAKYK